MTPFWVLLSTGGRRGCPASHPQDEVHAKAAVDRALPSHHHASARVEDCATMRGGGGTETSPAFSLFVASSNGLAICPEPNHPKWPMGGAPSGCSVPMGGASSECSAARFENSASSSSPLRPSSCCRSDSAVATASSTLRSPANSRCTREEPRSGSDRPVGTHEWSRRTGPCWTASSWTPCA